MKNLDRLNRQFAIPDHLDFIEGQGGLPVARIRNALANCDIALQGAHVLSYQPKGEHPVIWLSTEARFAPGKSIRGGIPVCWPWFGNHETDPDFPAHGFARTVMWNVLSSDALDDGTTRITFELLQTDATRAQWPHASVLRYTVSVGRELGLELKTQNTGDYPFRITEALHTYFDIGDIGNLRITGLSRSVYLDKLEAFKPKRQHGEVEIASEVDRVYVNTDTDCVIEDRTRHRRIMVAKQGGRSTVVWNPWIEKSEKMGDMGENGYRHMVCVESANANINFVTIAPGETHSLQAAYSVEKL
jgi:glucose-6-phosphate 1-epimerase